VKYLRVEMFTAANEDRIVRISAHLRISGQDAVRLFTERKVMTHRVHAPVEGVEFSETVVSLEKTSIAVLSERASEIVRVGDAVVFLPPEPDHRPDAYVGGLIEGKVNGESVTKEVLEEVLSIAEPAEAVAEFRDAMAKFA
jgi:hypothetical protein